MINTFKRLSRVVRYVLSNPREVLAKADAVATRDSGRPSYLQYRDGLPSIMPLNLELDPALESVPTLNVLLPGMAMRSMSGGPNTAINLVFRLAHLGVPIRFISTDIKADEDHAPLRNHFASLTGLPADCPNVEIRCGFDRSKPLAIGQNDVFFASAWWNVQMIKRALPLTRAKRFLYIIQDYEPALYAWSTQYALALETYSLDFNAIFCGRLLAQYMEIQKIGRFADPAFASRSSVFEPSVDRSRFHPDMAATKGRPRRLLFYARPTMASRNLFELGLYALRCASETGLFSAEPWELLFIGESVPNVDLGRGNIIRSAPWMGYEGYAKLLRESDVLLSLMLSPHSSYPPVEMSACGGLVVTNVYANKTSAALKEISKNIVPVAPTLEGVLEGLGEAVARVPDASRFDAPCSFPRSWDEAFGRTVPDTLEMFNSILDDYGIRKRTALPRSIS